MIRTLLALVALSLAGCGGGWSVVSAQHGLELGARAVQSSDERLAPIVDAAVDRCDQEHETREDFLECVEPYRPIGYGVSLGRHALRLGQATVDAWRTGESQGEAGWLPIAACIGHGLGEIAAAVRSLDLDAPELAADILMWVNTFGNLVAGVCPSEILEGARE